MNVTRTPLVFALLASVALVLAAGRARASPLSDAEEEALEDGEVDAEDVAVHGPWSSLAKTSAGRPVLGGRFGSTYLSVVGFSRATADDRREIGGLLVLGLPLDRLARGAMRVSPRVPAAYAGPEPTLASAREDLRLSPASEAASPFELALTPRLARACVGAAWRAAGLGADDARLDAIVSRARWSAVLPEARLRAIRSDDARLSLDTTTSTDTSKIRDSAGANVGFEARLTWHLSRLVYADDEPSFERVRLELRDARTRIGARVLEALFHWQRAALDRETLPPSQRGTRDEADVELRVMEAEAALDVLTNGWFSAHRSRRRPGAERPAATTPVPVGRGDL